MLTTLTNQSHMDSQLKQVETHDQPKKKVIIIDAVEDVVGPYVTACLNDQLSEHFTFTAFGALATFGKPIDEVRDEEIIRLKKVQHKFFRDRDFQTVDPVTVDYVSFPPIDHADAQINALIADKLNQKFLSHKFVSLRVEILKSLIKDPSMYITTDHGYVTDVYSHMNQISKLFCAIQSALRQADHLVIISDKHSSIEKVILNVLGPSVTKSIFVVPMGNVIQEVKNNEEAKKKLANFERYIVPGLVDIVAKYLCSFCVVF